MRCSCKLALIGEDGGLLAYRHQAEGTWMAGSLLQGGKCEPPSFIIQLPADAGTFRNNLTKRFKFD